MGQDGLKESKERVSDKEQGIGPSLSTHSISNGVHNTVQLLLTNESEFAHMVYGRHSGDV